jgi:energy-coupling factor transporter ATP-binding protein EcfA2
MAYPNALTNEPEITVPTAVLSTVALTKTYRMGEVNVHALRGIDLALYQGEFTVLLGVSGSGKSTLLNILGVNREAVAVLDHLKVESAPVIGLIRGAGDTHFIQLKTGQVFAIWLTATALGVSINPMSQTMRRPELRSAVRELMPSVGWAPQHLFRVGYSSNAPEPRTPRRPLEEVLL